MGCWAEIKDDLVLWVAPFVMAAMIATCCTCGKWTFICWFRYFGLIVGVRLFLWVTRTYGSKLRYCMRKKKATQKDHE
jgi:tellurite resistance protein TehA-like permease